MSKSKILIVASSNTGGEKTHIELLMEGLGYQFDFDIKVCHFGLHHFYSDWKSKIWGNYQIIHCHGLRSATYIRILAIIKNKFPPIVVTIHGFHYAKYPSLIKRWLFLRLEKFLNQIQTCTIAVSQQDYAFLHQYRCVPRTLLYIPNGIPQNNISEIEKKQILPQLWGLKIDPTKHKIIVTAGVYEWVKGQITLLQAAHYLKEMHPDIKYLIFGDGNLYQPFFQFIQDNNLQDTVFLMGNKSDYLAWLSWATLYVIPSQYEGLPISLLEAMRAGIPVIASNVPGCNELIEHNKNGLLFTKNHETELGKAIIYLLENPELAKSFIHKNKLLIKDTYTVTRMCEAILVCYNDIIQKSA